MSGKKRKGRVPSGANAFGVLGAVVAQTNLGIGMSRNAKVDEVYVGSVSALRPTTGTKLDTSYGKYLIGVGIMSFIAMLFLTGVVTVSFMAFTFVDPPAFDYTHVPFYEVPDPNFAYQHVARFGLNYFVVASHAAKYITIFGNWAALVSASRGGGTGFATAMIVWTVVFMIVNAGSSIYFLFHAIQPTMCAKMNLCRAFDSAVGDPASVAGVPNYYFLLVAWFSAAWLLVDIIYVSIMQDIKSSIEGRIRRVQLSANAEDLSIGQV